MEIEISNEKLDFKELLYLDGTPTNSKICNTRYGELYKVEHENGLVSWVDPYASSERLEKIGYKLGSKMSN